MRCPNCNKFVGMENGDPEVDNIEASADGDSIHVTATATGYRNCAECSTQLKSLCVDFEDDVALDKFDGWKDLPEPERAKFIAALEGGKLELEAESSSGEASESGGGRYAKNMITTALDYTLTATLGEKSLEYNGTLSSENAASEFEECC